MVAGLTVVEDVLAPVLQTYEVAPEAVKVDEKPGQTLVGEAVAVTVGPDETANVTVVSYEQP